MTGLERISGKRVLFLNWRDRDHPQAGGAEEYVEQIAARFALSGAEVTIFSSRFPGAPAAANGEGYRVCRGGGRFGVYAAAAAHAARFLRSYDAVVDCQNGIPFFTPLYVPPRVALVCVMHHVHQEQWDLYFRWPVNRVGGALERLGMRVAYRNHPFVAVSPSTRSDMRRLLGLTAPVHVVPNGIAPLLPHVEGRTLHPSIAVVTRLVPHKRLQLLIDAVPALLPRWPDLRVHLAGTGPEAAALAQQVHSLGLGDVIDLPGRVSDARKARLLAAAWLTVAPSVAEGWGLVVMEANSVGTPAVAFDVPGLRDSVLDGRTGWLVHGPDLTAALAHALSFQENPQRRAMMDQQCRAWAGAFSWDYSAERFADVLVSEMDRCSRGVRRRAAVDLSAVAEVEHEPGLEDHIGSAFRITDEWTRRGLHWDVLLTGCDEVDAVRALARSGLAPTTIRLATHVQLLSGHRAYAPVS